jgi:hypothetical protein
MSELLERFHQTADLRETSVRAPAALVFEVADGVELQSIFLFARSPGSGEADGRSFRTVEPAGSRGHAWHGVGEARLYAGPRTGDGLGDGALHPRGEVLDDPERSVRRIRGALHGEARLDARSGAAGQSTHSLSTETRARASGADVRAKFKPYWRKFRGDIVLIQRLLLVAIKKEVEPHYRTG